MQCSRAVDGSTIVSGGAVGRLALLNVVLQWRSVCVVKRDLEIFHRFDTLLLFDPTSLKSERCRNRNGATAARSKFGATEAVSQVAAAEKATLTEEEEETEWK